MLTKPDGLILSILFFATYPPRLLFSVTIPDVRKGGRWQKFYPATVRIAPAATAAMTTAMPAMAMTTAMTTAMTAAGERPRDGGPIAPRADDDLGVLARLHRRVHDERR